jgi:hypothetical protein
MTELRTDAIDPVASNVITSAVGLKQFLVGQLRLVLGDQCRGKLWLRRTPPLRRVTNRQCFIREMSVLET